MNANPATLKKWNSPYVYGAASLGNRETGRDLSGVLLVVLVKARKWMNVFRGTALTLMTWLPRYMTTAKSFSPEFGYVATPIVSIPATLSR